MYPFEASLEDLHANLDAYVDQVFASLTSEFLVMPKGPGFVEFRVFDTGYEALKRATGNFQRTSVASSASVGRRSCSACRTRSFLRRDEAVVVRMCHWMERDQKVTPLKDLQGLIWEDGYRSGELVSHLYPDVAPALRDWHARGLKLYIYSSGSVHAQRLIYGHTVAGDLTPLLAGYFDTRIGHKREVAAYQRIAEAIGAAPRRILFLSDVREELDAARAAGWQTVWLVRDGTPALAAAHRRVTRFDQVRV